MDQQQPRQIDDATSAEPKSEWTKPAVDRLIAGGAESGGGTFTDGIDIFS